MRSPLSVRVLPDGAGPRSAVLLAALERSGVVRGGQDVAAVVVEVPFVASATPLPDLEEVTWHAEVDEPLQSLLVSLQEARELLLPGGGAIVAVVPTIGVPGAASLVPLTTVVEGARAMVKSAARQWAADGIAVNILGLPLEALAPDLRAQTSHLLPPASGSEPAAEDVARALTTLLEASPALTGATIVVDGGQVMVP